MAIIADDESGGPGHLLNLIFSARTRVLAGDMAPAAVRSYLSGVLIGAEVMAGLTTAALILEENKSGEHIFILAEEPLLSRYKCVAEIAGAAVTVVDGNSVATAHLAIAQHAGMVK
jgi:2-dehydro-3-deoxygalactonokinase